MKKKLIAVLTLVFCLLLGGCGQKQPDVIRVGMLKGPTGISAAYLMEQSEQGKTNKKYEFSLFSSPADITAKIISGELDIAAVPTNNASMLYNKTEGKVQICAVQTLGTLYVLENGDSIKSIADLKGKKLYVSGQGATPEYALKYILAANGIDAEKDIEIEYVAEHAELATLLASGKAAIGLLPEPNVTSVLLNNKDCRIALDMTVEWTNAAAKNNDNGELTMGCVLVQKSFADSYKASLDSFMSEYEASVKYANSNIDETASLCEKFEIIPKAAVAKKAIPNCNIVYMNGKTMQAAVEGFLATLYNFNPSSVGGKLPDETFYYKK